MKMKLFENIKHVIGALNFLIRSLQFSWYFRSDAAQNISLLFDTKFESWIDLCDRGKFLKRDFLIWSWSETISAKLALRLYSTNLQLPNKSISSSLLAIIPANFLKHNH